MSSFADESVTRPRDAAMRVDRPSNNFDFVRLALAAMVVISHAFALRDRPLHEPLFDVTGGRLKLGELAVDGFFAISGLLIAGSFDRCRGLGDYALKRVARIYPGYLVAFALSVTLASWLAVGRIGAEGRSAAVLVANAATLGRPGFVPGRPGVLLNGAMWTIRPEFACYALLAIWGLIGGLRSRWLTALAAALVLSASACSILNLIPALRGRTSVADDLRLGTFFSLGSAAYAWRDALRFPWGSIVAAAVVAAAASLHPLTFAICFPPAFAYATLGVGSRSTPVVRDAARFGDFSYGVYLYAWPVQILMGVRHSLLPHPTLDALVVLLISLPLAALSWHLVERPALRWKLGHLGPGARHLAAIVGPPAVVDRDAAGRDLTAAR